MQKSVSRRRKLVFKTAIAIVALIAIEFISAVFLTLRYGGVSYVQDKRDKARTIDPIFISPGESIDVIHPYVGFVRQPAPTQDTVHITLGQHITEFGFNDISQPLHKRAPNQVIVGILGGSTAEQFATNTCGELEKELQKSPVFINKRFVFVRLALQGYKQPQQLMLVNYLLSLGGEFDILINLDGCNEAALPITENVPNNVHPCFPRSWHMRVAQYGNPVIQKLIGQITFLRQSQKEQACLFSRAPGRYLPSLTLLWKILHDRKDWMILEYHQRIGILAQDEISYCAGGPRITFPNERQLCQYCVALWSRSSSLLHQLCASNRIAYYHFLQPNPYVPGSAPLNIRDMSNTLGERQLYRKPLIDCYPLMIEEGKNLQRSGLRFHDLTMIFKDTPQPIYVDDFCHVNEEGNDIFARAIASAICEDQHIARAK